MVTEVRAYDSSDGTALLLVVRNAVRRLHHRSTGTTTEAEAKLLTPQLLGSITFHCIIPEPAELMAGHP